MSFVKRNAWTEAQIGAVLTELINKYCFSSHFLTAKIFTFIHFSTEIFSYFLKVIYKGVATIWKKNLTAVKIFQFSHIVYSDSLYWKKRSNICGNADHIDIFILKDHIKYIILLLHGATNPRITIHKLERGAGAIFGCVFFCHFYINY